MKRFNHNPQATSNQTKQGEYTYVFYRYKNLNKVKFRILEP